MIAQLPDNDVLVEHVHRLVTALADEIARRCTSSDVIAVERHEAVRTQARAVLLEWFSGEFIPRRK